MAEEIAQQRNGRIARLFEQQCGAAGAQRTIADFRDFQIRVHFVTNPDEVALVFQKGDEFT
jgi:hypothetical protein